MDNIINNPYLPYTGPIPQPFQPGYIIKVRGTVKPAATCFSINLQNDANTMPRKDVALHLSPVFTAPPRLVRNSIQNGQWGPEESHGSYFPFAAGQAFEILILAESDKFKIAVNGQHFTEFNHRLPMHMISHISIDGDADISSVKFEPSYGSHSPLQEGKTSVTGPIGFIMPGAPGGPDYNNPSSGSVPTGAAPFPYPSSSSYPAPSSGSPYPAPSSGSPYPAPSSGSPYPTQPSGGMYPAQPPRSLYPPSPQPGRASPTSPYGPIPPSSPYGPSPLNSPYGPPGGGYPSVPPSSPTSYPSHNYPSQPGPYPGTTVVYPGQENQKSGSSSNLNALAAGAAALAGAAGTALMGSKHKGGKHGHSLNPATALLGGGGMGHGGPAAMLASGMGSLLGGGGKQHGQKHSSSGPMGIPMGGALAGGAAALAGAYMLSKSPIGKVMKPKKMKKLYKHKHKVKHGFKGFGSSSSSSSSSEEE